MASSNINVGSLNKPIRIIRKELITDKMGFQTEEWKTLVNCRCKIEFDDRLIREVTKSQGSKTSLVKIFTFRYFQGLTEKDAIIYENEKYEIYGINNINEMNRFYKVWARRICR